MTLTAKEKARLLALGSERAGKDGLQPNLVGLREREKDLEIWHGSERGGAQAEPVCPECGGSQQVAGRTNYYPLRECKRCGTGHAPAKEGK